MFMSWFGGDDDQEASESHGDDTFALDNQEASESHRDDIFALDNQEVTLDNQEVSDEVSAEDLRNPLP
jgi:hypothetical protein